MVIDMAQMSTVVVVVVVAAAAVVVDVGTRENKIKNSMMKKNLHLHRDVF